MKTVSSCLLLSLYLISSVLKLTYWDIDCDVMEGHESHATEESSYYPEGKLRHEPSNTGKASIVGSASMSALILGMLAKTSDTQLLNWKG